MDCPLDAEAYGQTERELVLEPALLADEVGVYDVRRGSVEQMNRNSKSNWCSYECQIVSQS